MTEDLQTAALPEGWRTPEPMNGNETEETDRLDGHGYPACHVCEWCHSQPAEYHERNHDRFLCKGCAFNVAPSRPIVHRNYDLPFMEFQGDEYYTPEDLTFQLAKHTLSILGMVKGIGYGYDWEVGSHSTTRYDALFMLADFADQTHLAKGLLPWEDLNNDNESLLETAFFPIIRERLVLLIHTYPLLESLRSLCQAFDATDPDTARKKVLKALKLAVQALPIKGSTEDEEEPPKASPPTPRNRRKRGGLL
jgi:hypothetical protein